MAKYTKDGKTLEIEQDDYFDSPRTENDNLGVCVFLGNHKHLGDDHDIEDVEMALKKEAETISLPVYMYSHSGGTIATTPFSCPWDSGKLGFIYADVEKIKEEQGWKRLSAGRKETIKEWLKNEITTLDQYITGEVYSFEIKDKDGEVIDSCAGFYGDDEDQIFDAAGENKKEWTKVED